jgi:alcohol dehydrogenase class IV
MQAQSIIYGKNRIIKILNKLKLKNILLLHSLSYKYLSIKEEIERINVNFAYFGSISPNPQYEDICKAVSFFNAGQYDAIMAIGGGSVIDTAKCIKMFGNMNNNVSYLGQNYIKNTVPIIAIPTTAGAGSEATRFAVIYFNGEKHSISEEDIMPNYVVFLPELLKSLPLYQKKCSFLDALCQGIESWWSINSSDESKKYSKMAVQKLSQTMDLYFSENENSMKRVMEGANYAGKAINITQTTAPHAMSYKLTTMYGLPHGHAVAICLPVIWLYMTENIDKCIDSRGAEYLMKIFMDIAYSLGYKTVSQAIDGFSGMLKKMEIYPPQNIPEEDIALLTSAINLNRMKNTPVFASNSAVYELYNKILRN